MISQSVCGSSKVQPSKVFKKTDYVHVCYSGRYKDIFEKYAITQEFMAECIKAEAEGKEIDHPAKSVFKEALFDSISSMVYMLCNKYVDNCDKDVDDLAQDCFLRIVKRISNFNSKLGSFTMWSWYVCRSQLNSEYRHQIMRRKRFNVNVPTSDNSVTVPPACTLGLDITDVVRELTVKYPTQKDIIFAMFGGNPDEGELRLPSRISIVDIAERLNVEYAIVANFYHSRVRPLFQRRFN